MTTHTEPRTDPLDVLTAHRPTASRLDAAWSADRAGLALSVVASGAAARTGPAVALRSVVSSRRRWAVLSGAAATVAATAFAVTALLSPTGLPAASALGDLARTAGSGPTRTLGPGEYLHVVAREAQDNHPGAGARVPELGSDSDRIHASWTDADGTIWRRDAENGTVSYLKFDSEPSLTNPTPEFVASLPTVPDELSDYLRSHTSGSSSPDEAVFTGVGDMLRSGLASPQLSRAAIEVLAELPGVSVSDETFAGRAAVRVAFVDESARPGVVQSIHLDAATAAALGQSLEAPELTFTRTVLTQSVVTSLPADVAAHAIDDGSRAKGSGTPSP